MEFNQLSAEDAATRVTGCLGVPRWVLRQVVESKVKGHWHRIRGNRQEALVALRQYQYYSGMAAECFVLHREESATTGP